MKPQLAESIPGQIEKLAPYVQNPDWWFEQKIDGERLLVVCDPQGVTGRNRKGEKIAVSPEIAAAFQPLAHGNGCWIIDGEFCNGVFYVFDLPHALHVIDPTMTLEERRAGLEGVFQARFVNNHHVQLLPLAETVDDKMALFRWVVDNNGEGIMVKERNSAYIEGPLRSPYTLKYKLVETADVWIKELWRDGKRSVAVCVYDENHVEVPIGSVTMTEERLAQGHVGDVLEVRYLYVGAGGRLYQPRFLKWRTDKTPDECFVDQLKYGCKVVATADDYRTERNS